MDKWVSQVENQNISVCGLTIMLYKGQFGSTDEQAAWGYAKKPSLDQRWHLNSTMLWMMVNASADP